METALLLRTQQNDIYREIQRLQMPPSDFVWLEEIRRNGSGYAAPRAVPVLAHSPTKFDFMFDRSDKGLWDAYSNPHFEKVGRGYVGQTNSWQGMFDLAKTWLVVIAQEYFEPPLWHLNETEKALSAPTFEDMDNRKFTELELGRISDALHEIKAFLISTSGRTSEQLSFINTRLAHLQESSKRLGRKDWITLAMGTLTNIIVGVALAPEASRELLRNAGTLLGWIASGALSLP